MFSCPHLLEYGGGVAHMGSKFFPFRHCFQIVKGGINGNVLPRKQCRWPNVPSFCLGSPEISNICTSVVQIYLYGITK